MISNFHSLATFNEIIKTQLELAQKILVLSQHECWKIRTVNINEVWLSVAVVWTCLSNNNFSSNIFCHYSKQISRFTNQKVTLHPYRKCQCYDRLVT